MKNEQRYFWFFTLCVITAAFSLRSLITAVGPVVTEIKTDLGISSGAAGMLTTIPMIVFSITSFFAGAILVRFKVRVSAVACFILISAGVVIRSFLGVVGVYLGTMLLGFGIGTLNVLIPALNREKMPKQIGVLTGIYNVSLNLMAGIGSGCTYQLSKIFGGWRHAIAIWGIFPLIAIPLWIRLCNIPRFDDKEGHSISPFAAAKKYFSGKVWPLCILMAVQSFIYYSMVVTWGPTMLAEKGINAELVGTMMILLQIVSLVPSFLIPVNAVRPERRIVISVIGGSSYLFSTVIYLLFDSPYAMFLCCLLWGISTGSCFSYVLSLISLSGKTKEETTWISGFVQMFGYAFAAIGPVLFGFLVDVSGEWTIPMIFVMILSILYISAGIVSGKELEN